ncbi:MAG TPA: hypothetical protein VGE18_01855 [Candidatus Paceibacterota bacterium]
MKYSGTFIPLEWIIVFPQVRKTFEIAPLLELAEDISINGLINPCTVGKLDLVSYGLYKKTFETITGKDLGEIDISQMHNGYFYVLIAGERRYRAHKLLWEQGCSDCNKHALARKRILLPGACYRSHFGDESIEVRACLNVDAVTAKSIQSRENNYVKPPIHEEAEDWEEFYRYLRLSNSQLTFTGFAKEVGVSVERVRNALWFCELPKDIQLYVKQKHISATNALELRKILSLDIPEKRKREIIDREAIFLMSRLRINNKEYSQRVNAILSNLNQGELFALSSGPMTKKAIRKAFEAPAIEGLTLYDSFTKKAVAVEKAKEFGMDKLYSKKSASHQLVKIAKNLMQVAPSLFPAAELKKLRSVNLDTAPSEEIRAVIEHIQKKAV